MDPCVTSSSSSSPPPSTPTTVWKFRTISVLWRIVQSTKPEVRCVFLHISKRHVSLHPTSSRGHHSLKFHDSPSCVTNVITIWWGGGVAVALEPYNNISLSFLFSTHSSGMLNCMRARASVRETAVAECESVLLSSGAIYCTVCRRNTQCSFCLDRHQVFSYSENKRVKLLKRQV